MAPGDCPGAGAASLRAVRALVDRGEVVAVVSDLDGVLRVFDDDSWERLDHELDAPCGTAFAAILGHPVLEEVTRGRATHARWRELAVQQLTTAGIGPGRARAAVEHWAATPAVVDEAVRRLLESSRSAGLAVFVFTNGTDRVREEIEALGLGAVLGDEGEFLLNSAELGHAKPDQEAFRLAHLRIERSLGRPVRPEQVAFLDDSAGHVRAARAFGWEAVHHG